MNQSIHWISWCWTVDFGNILEATAIEWRILLPSHVLGYSSSRPGHYRPRHLHGPACIMLDYSRLSFSVANNLLNYNWNSIGQILSMTAYSCFTSWLNVNKIALLCWSNYVDSIISQFSFYYYYFTIKSYKKFTVLHLKGLLLLFFYLKSR